MTTHPQDWSFNFIANNLALEFTDTVSWRGSEQPIERFPEFAAVVSWARQCGLIDRAGERDLAAGAAREPGKARRAYRRAIRLRDLLYRVFAGIADQGRAPEDALAQLNAWVGGSLGRLELAGGAPPYRQQWRSEPDLLEPILGPVVKAAAELLCSEAVAKLRKCSSPVCGWLFLDISRTGRRRWCAMWACGNRAKASRFYRRRTA